MLWMIGKVNDLTPSIPYVVFTLSDLFLYLLVALTAKLEAVNKVLAEESFSASGRSGTLGFPGVQFCFDPRPVGFSSFN
jgi:hypothetical protein